MVVGVLLFVTVAAAWSVPKPRRGELEAEDWPDE